MLAIDPSIQTQAVAVVSRRNLYDVPCIMGGGRLQTIDEAHACISGHAVAYQRRFPDFGGIHNGHCLYVWNGAKAGIERAERSACEFELGALARIDVGPRLLTEEVTIHFRDEDDPRDVIPLWQLRAVISSPCGKETVEVGGWIVQRSVDFAAGTAIYRLSIID